LVNILGFRIVRKKRSDGDAGLSVFAHPHRHAPNDLALTEHTPAQEKRCASAP
jgi:hypothetical protein